MLLSGDNPSTSDAALEEWRSMTPDDRRQLNEECLRLHRAVESSFGAPAFPGALFDGYRCTFWPFFEHASSVTVLKQDGRITVHRRQAQLYGGGYALWPLIVDVAADLDLKQWSRLELLADRVGFWDMPEVIEEGAVLDGATWMVEALRTGQYHRVERISPLRSFTKLCHAMVALASPPQPWWQFWRRMKLDL